jgi:hypothetical protein
MYKIFIVYFLTLMSVGCLSTDTEEFQPAETLADTPAMVAIPLNEFAMPIGLMVEPSEKDEIELSWNASFGRLEVRKGKSIDFFVVQDTVTCLFKSVEIESGIFEIEYIEKTDNVLIYKAKLPGGDTEYHHFFASFEIDGVRYNFENNPLVEASEKHIAAMLVQVMNFSTLKNDAI